MKRLDRHSRAIIVLALVVTLAAVLLTFGHWLPTASMQSTQDVVVEEVSRDVGIDQKYTGSSKKQSQIDAEAVGNFAPELITAGTYAFTNSGGAVLENMSSGTTQLVAADVDDAPSPVTNIGF